MQELKETIKKLEELRLHCQEYATDRERDGEFDTVWHEDVQALDIAIDVIEKEIPEKPIFKTDYDVSVNYYTCPICRDMVTNKKDEPDYYCSGCGQKINWGV